MSGTTYTPLVDLPAPARWEALDERLAELVAPATAPTPMGEYLRLVQVEEVAQAAGLSVERMVMHLEQASARPFKLGKRWVIRETNLAAYYLRKEAEDA